MAHELGLRVHMDGARFANAVAALGVPPRTLTWQAGVDVLCFGGTKNGLAAGDALIFFNRELAEGFEYRRKQAGHLLAKMRYLAAQFLGLLEDRLWLRNATQANLMARRLAEGVRGVPGVELRQAVESNAVFAALPPAHIDRLQREWEFHVWDETTHVVRWMTAFDTTEADVDAFAAAVLAAAPNGSPAGFT